MSTQEVSIAAQSRILPPIQPSPHRFSVEQYHRMIEAGVLTRADRVQLLEGVIVDMTPIGIAHAYAVQGLMRALVRILPDGWDVFVQQPVSMAGSEPEPDLAIVRGSYSDYSDRRPTAADVAVLIEVAETSLEIDRKKIAIYARAGVPEYWLVNLPDRQIEIRRGPKTGAADPGYETFVVISAESKVPLVLDGKVVGEIALSRVYPRRDD